MTIFTLCGRQLPNGTVEILSTFCLERDGMFKIRLSWTISDHTNTIELENVIRFSAFIILESIPMLEKGTLLSILD